MLLDLFFLLVPPPTPVVVGAGTGSSLRSHQEQGRFRTPYDDRVREQKLREEEEIAVLIALGVL